MDISQIKQKVVPILKKDKDILFGYLFGSQATKKANFESDVDIALYLNKKCKDCFQKRLSLIEKIQGVLKKPAEIIILNEQKSIFFKFVIIKEGKVIFDKHHGERVDFELRTMQEYYDFQPFIKEYNKAYLERSLK